MAQEFSEAYQTVVQTLPTLTQAERKALFSVLRKLDSSLQTHAAKETRRELYRWTPSLYSVLAKRLKLNHKQVAPDVNLLPEATIKAVNKLAVDLDVDLRAVANNEGVRITPRDRGKWYQLYVRITANYLQYREVPVSLRTLCQNYDKFLSLLDLTFPQYMSTGLFIKLVLRHRRSWSAQ